MKAAAGETVRSGGAAADAAARPAAANGLRGQIVVVLQGGGALGAYHAGVFGAINAALIAGNAPELRLQHLQAFWRRVKQRHPAPGAVAAFGMVNLMHGLASGALPPAWNDDGSGRDEATAPPLAPTVTPDERYVAAPATTGRNARPGPGAAWLDAGMPYAHRRCGRSDR